MIQPDLLTRLRLLAEAYRLPVAATDRPREVTPVSAAQQVLAEVEARLPDGRFRVLAAGQRFDVDLPAGTRPGERVQVLLPQPSAGASQIRTPAPLPADVEANLSGAGLFLAHLVEGESAQVRTPVSLGAAQPLLPDAPPDVAKTAATLRELIGLSGLFYESHQAEWVNGTRETAQLLREPQGRNAPLPAETGPALPAGIEDSEARLSGFNSAIHPNAAPIVQQQLNALETSHLVWSGQIWPGQQMRWEIEPSEREAGDPDDAMRAWQTRIDLDLPRLGNLTAVLHLDPAGLRVRVSAQAADTDALLDRQLADLQSALAAAGLPLASVMKARHADA